VRSTEGGGRAVIFDLDGVLVDSEGLHVDAWKILFARHGISVSDEEYAHGIGMADVDWIEYLFGRRGSAVRRIDPVWWQDAKRVLYRDILAHNVRPFPGVVELVRGLWPEFRLGVASNSWREDIETVLRGLDIRACFDALTGKEDVARHKPDPEAYVRTAAALGVEPAACAVIEDSPLGIQAAKEAGMRCVGVATTLPAGRLGQADLVLASIEDLEPILRFVRGLGKESVGA